ncbi:MAG: J domain-containing protein [Bdellovibrionota bacterium]
MSYTPEQLQQIAKAATLLDQMDYYQVLKIAVGAPAEEIKSSFFKQSRVWHPDRFFRRVPEETYQQVMKIYMRVSEAYSILRDDKVRPLYESRIKGPERANHLRYDKAVEEAKQRAKKDEDVAKTEPGKKYAKMAFGALNQKNLASAEMNFKLAFSMESDNLDLKYLYLKCRRDNKGKLTPEDEQFLSEREKA